MPFVTSVDPDTLRAYRETHYRVRTPPLTLRIGLPCPALTRLHARYRVSGSAFVTACNPRGHRLDESANAERMLTLARELDARGLVALDAIGEHPTGDWSGEPSLLVIGLGRAATRSLGERFEQNAVVWCGADAVPELILLR